MQIAHSSVWCHTHRYINAIKSFKANSNIMVLQSDKGKQMVICYRTTYLSLVNTHFGNRDLYLPVDISDAAGHNLKTMTDDLKRDLSGFISRAPNADTKKLIKSFLPPVKPRFPLGRCNLKTHKEGITETNIPVRPIISNSQSPTSNLAGYLGKILTRNLGQVSDKHLKSTEDFAVFARGCTNKGKLISLDVESLFTCVPTDRIIGFLRDQSDGWGSNPPTQAKPVNPPLYNFGMDSEFFCDLVELCLSYNQFQVGDGFFRQIHGLFMGSPISPPLAQMYMEYFESELYEKLIPDDIKPTEFKRYVDDCFTVYEHSEASFQEFIVKLNALDPYINFTYEKSKPGVDIGLPSNVLEALPFLDLKVVRYLDQDTNIISNKLLIHRKDCHSGSYTHFLSNQPTSIKRAVIRNMFLRAFRYCDTIFMEQEMRKIYSDFGNLGYNVGFITKAKISARKGRNHELLVRAGQEPPRPPRERSRYHIGLPFHKVANGLRHRLRSQGVELTFSSRNSIIRHITPKTNTQINSGVYILRCKKPDCERIYIGQSEDIPGRLKQHTDARTQPSKRYYTSATHSRLRGHEMDTVSELVPYKSKSLSHRLVVESSLIASCHTIKGNKASSSTRDMDVIAPMILKGSSINWKSLVEAQPTKLRPEVIPTHCRRMFHHIFGPSESNIPPDIHGSTEVISNIDPGNPNTYYLRSSGSI